MSQWAGWNSNQSWKDDDWQNQSPWKQSARQQTEDFLPKSFAPDHTHLDTNPVPSPNGYVFYRQVESTPWSRKVGLSGREVMDLRIHELAYHGLNEQSLRHLSHGRFTSVVFCRSVAEAVMTNRLLQAFRSRGIDIDQAAKLSFAQKYPGKAVPDKGGRQ